jgi:hypothetical protein
LDYSLGEPIQLLFSRLLPSTHFCQIWPLLLSLFLLVSSELLYRLTSEQSCPCEVRSLCWSLVWLTLRSWKRRQYVSPNHRWTRRYIPEDGTRQINQTLKFNTAAIVLHV